MDAVTRFFRSAPVAAIALLGAGLAIAAPSDQGFETDTGDWVFDSGSTARVASGAGTLGVPSASGDFHVEAVNVHDSYQAGYGTAGYSYFGGRDGVYAGAFYQSIDVYIDPAWSGLGFFVDMAPANTDGTSFYAAESNFRLSADGSSVSVRAINGPVIATITTPGWHTFETIWARGANPADLVDMTLNAYDAEGTKIGSWATQAIYPDGGGYAGESQYLGNNSYVWIAVWQNGFANDVLAIDNVRTGLGTVEDILGAGSTTHSFKTTLSAADNADVDDLNLAITCNSGLPLNQTAASGTTFVVTELADGSECSIALDGDLASGWMAGDMMSGPLGGPYTGGCDITVQSDVSNEWECVIEVVPTPFTFSVMVDWLISADADQGIGAGALAHPKCFHVWDIETSTYVDTPDVSIAADPDADMPITIPALSPAPDGHTYCTATVTGAGSTVELDLADCSSVDVGVGDTDVSCTIVATAFYEGIPALGPYGKAIMALLLLGLGVVGLRRFA